MEKQRVAYHWPERAQRLYVCGLLRHALWDLLPEPELRAAVDAAEAYADDPGTPAALRLEKAARGAARAAAARPPNSREQMLATQVLVATRLDPKWKGRTFDPVGPARVVRDVLACLDTLAPVRFPDFIRLNDRVFDDVERQPVAFDPEWRSSAALALAGRMYESRDFGPMPILADALEEAGCGDAAVLAHCRGRGPHVRGCWVVDHVLARG